MWQVLKKPIAARLEGFLSNGKVANGPFPKKKL